MFSEICGSDRAARQGQAAGRRVPLSSAVSSVQAATNGATNHYQLRGHLLSSPRYL